MKKLKQILIILTLVLTIIPPIQVRADNSDEWSTSFEDDGLMFEPRGDNEELEVTGDDARTGEYSLRVSERSEPWNGPSLRIEEQIEQSVEYTFSVWAKIDGEATADLQLSTQIGEGDNASYQTIDSQSVSPRDWVQLQGTYRYDAIVDNFVTVYVETTSNATVSYLIDDFSMERADSATDVSVQTDLTPLKDIYEDYFLIGNAVSMTEMEGQRLDLLRHHHNLVTAENAMKPEYAYDSSRSFNFNDQQRLVDRIQEEGFYLHGHVLVWHQQSPEWLHTVDGQLLSREEALENMYTHIEETIIHYGDDVIAWEVVNEAMNDNPRDPENWRDMLRRSDWYDAIGDDYLELAYRKAREVLDENGWEEVKLYYNDYNDDNQSKSRAIYYMVQEINETYAEENPGELLIDGVGMQGHYNASTIADNVRQSIERFRELGVEIGVTELDITSRSSGELSEEEELAQALLYAELFAIYKEHADVISRVTFWGLNDATSWRSENNPLLFDENLQAKQAYYAVADPEAFLAQHQGNEEAAEVRTGQAAYGTPDLSENTDDLWENSEELNLDRYQLAWQGATGSGRVLWDEDNLYVRIQVSDSSRSVTGENPWEQDSVEVFVEESFDRSTSYETGAGQYRVNAEGEETFGEMTDNTSIESVVFETEEGYVVHMAIPWVESSPASGDSIGFDLQINDADSGSRESVAVWNDLTGQAFQNPSVFGELELVRVEGAGETASEEDSVLAGVLVYGGIVGVILVGVISVIILRKRK